MYDINIESGMAKPTKSALLNPKKNIKTPTTSNTPKMIKFNYFPKEKIGFCMGAWLLANGCGQTLAGKIAGYIAMPDKGISSGESLSIFSNYFKNFSIVSLIVAIIFTLIAIFIRRVGKKHLIKFA